MFYIQKKSAAGITNVPLETELLNARQVYISGEINAESMMDTCQKLLFLARESDQPITLLINSCGGEVTGAGLMLIDVLETIGEIPVNIVVMGKAYSMAALILAIGEKGRRLLLPNSRIMIHAPMFAGGFEGTKSSIKTVTENLNAVHQKTVDLLVENTGRTVEEIEAAISKDTYFTAEDAIEFGLADRIIGISEVINGMEV